MMTRTHESYKTLILGSAIEIKKLKKQIKSLQRLVNGRDSYKLPEGKKDLLLDKLREAQKNALAIRAMLFRNRAIWAFVLKENRETVSTVPLSEGDILFIYHNSVLNDSYRTFSVDEPGRPKFKLDDVIKWNNNDG